MFSVTMYISKWQIDNNDYDGNLPTCTSKWQIDNNDYDGNLPTCTSQFDRCKLYMYNSSSHLYPTCMVPPKYSRSHLTSTCQTLRPCFRRSWNHVPRTPYQLVTVSRVLILCFVLVFIISNRAQMNVSVSV